MLFPVREQDLSKCKYNSAYGDRVHPVNKTKTKHRGIDIAMPVGTSLVATEDGTVQYSKNNPGGYGYYLVINHGGQYTLYAHLKELSKFKAGQKVKQGEVVAYSGNTGNSTGPHLHFEIHERNFKFPAEGDFTVDPLKYFPNLKNYYNKVLTGYKESTYINVNLLGKDIQLEGKFENNTNYIAFKRGGKVEHIPVREYFEPLGLAISWDESKKKVVLK